MRKFVPSSPLLKDVEEPIEVMRVLRATPILLCSEKSFVFQPLKELGWVAYGKGRWNFTEAGLKALADALPVEELDQPQSLGNFFGTM